MVKRMAGWMFIGVLVGPSLAAEPPATDAPITDAPAAETAAAGLVRGDPETLALRADDLPVVFAISGGDVQPGGGYAALFFRPEALAATEPDGAPMGVMLALELFDDVAAAKTRYADGDASRPAGPGAGERLLETRTLEPRFAGADAAEGTRVVYELQGVRVIEYRFRLRHANAIANLRISGRAGAGGVEPEALAEAARDVVERQLKRLAAARE